MCVAIRNVMLMMMKKESGKLDGEKDEGLYEYIDFVHPFVPYDECYSKHATPTQ